YGFLAFNLRANGDTSAPHPLFGNRELRRAIVMALDREGMLHNVWGGGDLAAVPPGPMPRLWSLWDSSLARNLAHDSVAAARLLAAQRGRRAFHLLVPTTSGLRRQYARLIQAQLQPFGWDVRIDELDLAVVQQRVGAGQFDAVLGAWYSGPSPIDGTLQNWTRRGFGGLNPGRYDNPQLDRLLEGAARTRSREPATRQLRSAIALWNSDAPAAPLYAPDNVAAVNRRVSEVTIRPDSWLALVEADKPVERAEALRARVEIYALRGDLDLAHHDLDALAELRGFVPNSIHDAEDLRVVALVRAAEGDLAAAERALHEVIRRAEVHRQPQLQAAASQDLATLRRAGFVARAQVQIDPPSGS